LQKRKGGGITPTASLRGGGYLIAEKKRMQGDIIAIKEK
jgi:hypothetical protein